MNQCFLIGEHGTYPLDTRHSLLKPTGYRTQANNSPVLERDGAFTQQELSPPLRTVTACVFLTMA